MRWRFILEEYIPQLIYELIYIQSSKYIVAGASSRLNIVSTYNSIKSNMSSYVEYLSLKKEDILHPFYYKIIIQRQQNNKSLIEAAKLNKDYLIKHFYRADKKYSLICRKHKIVIPKLVEKQIAGWYHNTLCHTREICTELSIAQHLYRKIYVKLYMVFALNTRPINIQNETRNNTQNYNQRK